MFTKVKRFFDMGLYGEAQVFQFVAHGILTEEEYQSITGDPEPTEEIAG